MEICTVVCPLPQLPFAVAVRLGLFQSFAVHFRSDIHVPQAAITDFSVHENGENTSTQKQSWTTKRALKNNLRLFMVVGGDESKKYVRGQN